MNMNSFSNIEYKAIEAAMQSRWIDAIELNLKLHALDKTNIDTLLRLGFSYLQTNNIKDAKKFYSRALKIQPSNSTIIKNLEKILILEGNKNKKSLDKTINLNPYLFLEIPGKTKSVILVNPGQKNILAGLSIGQEVAILPKKRKIEIRTKTNDFIGVLPDDISKRMSIFIKGGSSFAAYIKEAGLNSVIVFIKELKKGKKVMKYASFPTNFQSNILEMTAQTDEALGEEDSEDLSENDLEKLAESLATEEKEYLPIDQSEQEETEE